MHVERMYATAEGYKHKTKINAESNTAEANTQKFMHKEIKHSTEMKRMHMQQQITSTFLVTCFFI
jgi:hypothetical protein